MCTLAPGAGLLRPSVALTLHACAWLPPSELAQAVVDAGAVPLLVLCIQEPEISLKRITASALNDIAKHSPELAQAVVDAGAVAFSSCRINGPVTSNHIHVDISDPSMRISK